MRAARALHLKKHRIEQRCFLIEGPTAVAAALDADRVTIERLFALAGGEVDRSVLGRAAARKTSVLAVDERTMRSLAQTQHPQGVVAVARFFHYDAGDLQRLIPALGPAIVLVLHDAADPGNAGTLARSAEAFGAKALCFGAHAVDPYNDKVIRSSMGSLFHVPLVIYDEWADLNTALRAVTLAIIGAEAGAPDVRSVTLPNRGALVVGNERRGLADIPSADIQLRVGIPQAARAESLNAAVAGSIALYELARATGALARDDPMRTSGA